MKESVTLMDLDNFIMPQRCIPFDIGITLSNEKIGHIKDCLKENGCAISETPSMLLSLSRDAMIKADVTPSLRLYIFSYGIGVFILEDEPYHMENDYAVNYCQSRKDSHKEILEFKHGDSSIQMRTIINALREVTGTRGSKGKMRLSANNSWEHEGLSYVMTVSYCIQKHKAKSSYESFSDYEKKNLQIMLFPELAHKEDSMFFHELDETKEDFDPYKFDINKIEAPRNWSNSENYAVYISWAAVIVYMPNLLGKYMNIIEYLEVDLQAMWLYIYCQHLDLEERSSKKLTSGDLKREKYNFQRKYNEFISSNYSSMPSYIKNLRNELIRTSDIEKEKNNLVEYLEFCIDEVESRENEQQRKYSVINEILLFIIAFIQIAPMLYSVLLGEIHDIKIWPIAVMVALVVVAIAIIVRKDL